jgi:hypothetical protein
MHFDHLSFGAVLALFGGPMFFVQGFRDLRVKRLIQNTPTARIRSMAMGLVEINGKVGARSTVTAPFSGRPCVYWQIDIATRGGGRRRNWTTVHKDASGNPFFLRDGTGTALVYPHDAECKVTFQIEEECLGVTLPEPYVSYVKSLGPRHLLWQLGTMRFRERILEDGQEVYVLGTAMPRPQVLTISEGEALAATGTDGARAPQARALREEVAAVVRRGESETTFIISQSSERLLTVELGLRATLKLVGGPALTVFGLGYWLYAISSVGVFGR